MTVSSWHGPPYDQSLLAATADRERAVDLLRAGFAEGRLTQQEHEARVGRVYAARTYADLTALVADLPSGQWAFPGYPVAPPPVRPAAPFREQRTNALAISSLVCGFLFPPGSILAVIFGHTALAQIRRTGERGTGLAVAGLVLGWAGVFLMAIFFVGFVALTRNAPGP
jgi:Domain of unknown function (DUF4190)/Domain of unknown function (DUF1707)